MLFLSITVGCLIAAASAAHAIQTFSGDFTDSYVDIPFIVDVHSEVKFEYDSLCENSADLRFYLRVSQRVDNFDAQYSITSRTDTTSPVESVATFTVPFIEEKCLLFSSIVNVPPNFSKFPFTLLIIICFTLKPTSE